MSDTTFSAAFVAPAGAAKPAARRAGVRRYGPHEASRAHNVIEGTCLFAAMAFASLVLAGAFGVAL